MAAVTFKGTAAPRRRPQQRFSLACSICDTKFALDDASAGNNLALHATTGDTPSSSSRRRHPNTTGGSGSLDASFVNIPHYPRPPSQSKNENNDMASNYVHDIESILEDALRLDSARGSRCNNVNGADMKDASRKMDMILEAAMVLLSSGGGPSVADDKGGGCDSSKKRYCLACLDRIGTAIETCTERLDEECIAYDNVASLEEERTILLSNVLSMNSSSDTSGLGLDDIHAEEDDAIHRAIESFQYELDSLANACNEQEKELSLLQIYMRDQMDRSSILSTQEDIVHQELNTLEIDARNFGEESHLVSNSCSAIENEIDAMSRVRLMSIPFTIRVAVDEWEEHDDDAILGQKKKKATSTTAGGRYPTINNLRLAYRTNEKAGLHRDEINAAFSNAAQLMAFTLGLYPSLITSTIRIIPIHPCAKILVNLPEGQSVHNLGFDTTTAAADVDQQQPNHHVPTQSITLFLVLLSELSCHIIENATGAAAATHHQPPPFSMTEFSIDNVDVTKLADSNTSAWSSVVFCIAANLRWLSELKIGE